MVRYGNTREWVAGVKLVTGSGELMTLGRGLVKDSSGATLGQPFVKGASVELKVMAHRRGPKIMVYKMRPKKKTRRKNGHRQELTRVMVQSIQLNGKAVS